MSAVEAVPARTRADQDLQALYERHADRIFGFCRRRLRSHQEAEDATQTTFLQAFRALQRGVEPVSETAWLFKIAENVCHSAHRTNGRRSEHELADGAEIIEFASVREGGNDALIGLDEALAAIPESQRRAFVLRELRGLSYKEIASAIGVSVTSVEMLVFRARRGVARSLESGAALKGRVASLIDLGAVLNLLKTGFGGATAAKVVAIATVVAVSTVPAGDGPLPQERTGQTVVAGRSGQPPRVPVAESGEHGTAVPDRAAGRPAASPTPSRDRPRPDAVEARPGQPAPGRRDEEPDRSAAPPETEQTAPPATPAPSAPVAPPPPTIPAPSVPPLEVPELPVDVPTLPALPPLPVELPSDELLPPPPQLP